MQILHGSTWKAQQGKLDTWKVGATVQQVEIRGTQAWFQCLRWFLVVPYPILTTIEPLFKQVLDDEGPSNEPTQFALATTSNTITNLK